MAPPRPICRATAISGHKHGLTSFAGGLSWRTGASGFTSGAFSREYDALSRYNQIRDDSLVLGPVMLAASVGKAGRWELAGRVNTALAGGKLSGPLLYGQDHGRSGFDDTRYGGSFSYLFSQGANPTVAHARNDEEATGGIESDVISVKLGHR